MFLRLYCVPCKYVFVFVCVYRLWKQISSNNTINYLSSKKKNDMLLLEGVLHLCILRGRLIFGVENVLIKEKALI